MAKQRALVITVSGEGLKDLNELLGKDWEVHQVHALGNGSSVAAWLVVAQQKEPAPGAAIAQ